MTLPGAVDPEDRSSLHAVEFWSGGERVADEWAAVDYLSDDRTRWVVAPLPEGFDAIDRIVHVENGVRRDVDPRWVDPRH
jgi:hypothetical protein